MKRLRLLISALVLSVSAVLPLLSPVIVHATPNNCTWTGTTNNNFNTAGNWTGCNSTVPQAADNLVFDNTSLSVDTTLNNNIVGLSVGTVTFQGTNGPSSHAFTLTGNALTVNGTIATSSTTPNVNLPLTLGAAISITGFGIDTSALGTINLNGHNLTVGTGSDTPFVNLSGALSGTGNLNTLTGADLALQADNSGLTGAVNIASGSSVEAHVPNALGSSSSTVAVTSGGSLDFCGLNDGTVPQAISVGGAGLSSAGALVAVVSCGMGGGGGGGSTAAAKVTLSGAITLTADTVVTASDTLTLTGALSGSFAVALHAGSTGSLVINSSNNTSNTPNGTNTSPVVSVDYNANSPSTPIDVPFNTTANVDGTYGSTSVDSGGILKGTGTVGDLSVFAGGTVAPGHSPGCLNSGNLTLSGTFQAELGGTDACTGYDQMKVTGTVDVTDGTLSVSLYNGFKPSKGSSFTIIDNDASDAVVGTFTNMDEGSTFTVGGYVFAISYVGGDGNDVVLTVQDVPATPDTGFMLIKNNPIVSAVVIIAAAAGVAFIANRKKFAFSRSRSRR